MRNSAHLFGAFGFRKCNPQDLLPGARRRLLNNLLFTNWFVVLAERDETEAEAVEHESFARIVARELVTDADYYDSVSVGVGRASRGAAPARR